MMDVMILQFSVLARNIVEVGVYQTSKYQFSISRPFASHHLHLQCSKIFKGLECVLLFMVLYIIKNPFRSYDWTIIFIIPVRYIRLPVVDSNKEEIIYVYKQLRLSPVNTTDIIKLTCLLITGSISIGYPISGHSLYPWFYCLQDCFCQV